MIATEWDGWGREHLVEKEKATATEKYSSNHVSSAGPMTELSFD
jgi:hypothetical protein